MQQIPDDKPIDMRDWVIRYSIEISGRGACACDFNLTTPNPKPGLLAAAVPTSLRAAVARVAGRARTR
jgi:hypothetical protein